MPFDPTDPVNTPRGLNTDEPARSGRRCATRSPTCDGSAFPLDAHAARRPVRAARRREDPDPRRPRRPERRVQRDQRAVGGGRGLPERAARLELRDGRAAGRTAAPTRARSSPTRSRRTRPRRTSATRRGCSAARSGSTCASARTRSSPTRTCRHALRRGAVLEPPRADVRCRCAARERIRRFARRWAASARRRRAGGRRARLTARPPKGRYRIRVTAKTSRKRTIKLDRRARTCAKRVPKGRAR